jgi:hypothetical protein
MMQLKLHVVVEQTRQRRRRGGRQAASDKKQRSQEWARDHCVRERIQQSCIHVQRHICQYKGGQSRVALPRQRARQSCPRCRQHLHMPVRHAQGVQAHRAKGRLPEQQANRIPAGAACVHIQAPFLLQPWRRSQKRFQRLHGVLTEASAAPGQVCE